MKIVDEEGLVNCHSILLPFKFEVKQQKKSFLTFLYIQEKTDARFPAVKKVLNYIAEKKSFKPVMRLKELAAEQSTRIQAPTTLRKN